MIQCLYPILIHGTVFHHPPPDRTTLLLLATRTGISCKFAGGSFARRVFDLPIQQVVPECSHMLQSHKLFSSISISWKPSFLRTGPIIKYWKSCTNWEKPAGWYSSLRSWADFLQDNKLSRDGNSVAMPGCLKFSVGIKSRYSKIGQRNFLILVIFCSGSRISIIHNSATLLFSNWHHWDLVSLPWTCSAPSFFLRVF